MTAQSNGTAVLGRLTGGDRKGRGLGVRVRRRLFGRVLLVLFILRDNRRLGFLRRRFLFLIHHRGLVLGGVFVFGIFLGVGHRRRGRVLFRILGGVFGHRSGGPGLGGQDVFRVLFRRDHPGRVVLIVGRRGKVFLIGRVVVVALVLIGRVVRRRARQGSRRASRRRRRHRRGTATGVIVLALTDPAGTTGTVGIHARGPGFRHVGGHPQADGIVGHRAPRFIAVGAPLAQATGSVVVGLVIGGLQRGAVGIPGIQRRPQHPLGAGQRLLVLPRTGVDDAEDAQVLAVARGFR